MAFRLPASIRKLTPVGFGPPQATPNRGVRPRSVMRVGELAVRNSLPSVEGPCRALHAEGYPIPERIRKMIGHEG